MLSLKKLIKNKFIIDSFWTIWGNFIGKGFSFLCTLFLAKILESYYQGINEFFRSTISSISFFALFGIHITITSFISKLCFKNDKEELVKSVLYYICLTSIFFSLFYTLLIYNEFEKFKINIIIFYLLILIGSVSFSFNYLFNGLYAGLGYFKRLSFISMFNGVLNFTILTIIASYHSLIGVIYATPFLFFFISLVYFFDLKKNGINCLPLKHYPLPKIFKLSFPIALQEICFPLYSWSINYIIIYYVGNAFLGIYSTAMSFYILILFVPGILRNVLLRHFAISEVKNSKEVFKQAILINFVSILIPLIVVYISFDTIVVFLGDSYIDLKALFFPISIMAIIASISNPYFQYFIHKSMNWKLFFLRFLKNSLALIIVYVSFYYDLINKDFSLKFILYVSSLTALVQLFLMIIKKPKDYQ